MRPEVGLVAEVSDSTLSPLAPSRARFASDNDSNTEPEQANGRNAGSLTSAITATGADRWPIVCRLLAHPSRESRRLARLLERWPHVAHRHELADDCQRRQWRRV